MGQKPTRWPDTPGRSPLAVWALRAGPRPVHRHFPGRIAHACQRAGAGMGRRPWGAVSPHSAPTVRPGRTGPGADGGADRAARGPEQ